MSQADLQYNRIIQDILDLGIWDSNECVRTKWADGNPAYTKSLITRQMVFDNSEVPLITTKKVAWKTAIKEILWIWQKKSNIVETLRKMGCTIWDEWEQSDGTIGKAYGYQLGKKCRNLHGEKVDQVDYLLYQLKNNPSSRRNIVSLWNIDDLDDMALEPCVWCTQWIVQDGKLNLVVQIRSNDMALGNPFNVFQYYVLQRMISQVTGHVMGSLSFNINIPHIYDRHIEKLKSQISRPLFDAPILWLNPKVKNFYDFTIDDFVLLGYQHGEQIQMEVAV